MLVRINAAGTRWHEADLALCGAEGVAGIVLAKAEHIGENLLDLVRTRRRFLFPLIETALGVAEVRAIARVEGVARLLFGRIDLQLDLGIDGENEKLDSFRSELVLASRLAGIEAPIDGVCTAIDRPAEIEADTLRAKRFGFGGKLCIHPKQVEIVNRCFAPTPEDIAWARRVLAAAATAGGAAVAVDGRLVDRPVIAKAENIAREAERLTPMA